MPGAGLAIAFGALAGAGGAFIAGTSLAIGALVGGGLAAVQYFLTDQSGPNLDAYSFANSDNRKRIVASIQDKTFRLGRVRTAGWLVFVEEDDNERDLHAVIALSQGPIDAVEKIWIKGEEVRFTQNGREIRPDMESDYHGNLEITTYFEADGSGGAELAAVASEWGDSQELNGVSWLYIKYHQPDYGRNNDNRIWAEVDEVEFLIRGKKITWPGQATPAWTNNAAAIRYWWLTERRGFKPAEIDAASFRAAFALCGANVTLNLPPEYREYNPTGIRYGYDGTIRSSDPVAEVEKEMDFGWQGFAVEYGGMVYFRPGADRTIDFEITEDDIIEEGEVITAPAIQARVNAATMTLAASDEHSHLQHAIPELVDDPALRRDGNFKLARDLGRRVLVNNVLRAARLMAIYLRRSRGSLRKSIRVKPGDNFERLSLIPSDWVALTNPKDGFNKFTMMVEDVQIHDDLSMTLSLAEQLAGVYADSLELPPLKARDIQFDGRRTIPAPTGLTAIYSFEKAPDGKLIWGIELFVDSSPYDTRIVIKDSRDRVVHESTFRGRRHYFVVDMPGVYTIEAVHVSRDGFVSKPAILNVTLADWGTNLPGEVTNARVTQLDDGTRHYSWMPPADPDLAGVRIRYTSEAENNIWRNMIRLQDGYLTSSPLELFAPAAGRYYFSFRAQNTMGLLGPEVRIGPVELTENRFEMMEMITGGTRLAPTRFFVSITNQQKAILEGLGVGDTLPAAFVALADNAAGGEPIDGDFVYFINRASAFSQAWTWVESSARWRYTEPFIAAQLLYVDSLRALNIKVVDADIEGTITAEHIDADVQNFTPLWRGSRYILNQTYEFELSADWRDFDVLQIFVVSANEGFAGVVWVEVDVVPTTYSTVGRATSSNSVPSFLNSAELCQVCA